MSSDFGEQIDARSTMYVHRLNQKMIWSGDGADLAALDYVTNLVSRYAFNQNGNDSVGSNHLTPNGTPTYVRGRYGYGTSLNGSSQDYTGGDIHDITTGSKTVTGWFKLNAVGSLQVIVSKRDASVATNDGWAVAVNSSNKIFAAFCDGSASVITATGTTTLTTGVWYFFAVVFDRAANMTIYLGTKNSKGIANEASTSIVAQNTTADNAVAFAIGKYGAGTANRINGVIDQVQIFSAALSSANCLSIFEDLHAGQLAFAETTSGSFIGGTAYQRNSENTAWNPLNGIDPSIYGSGVDGIQTVSGTTVLAANKEYTVLRVDAGAFLDTAGFTVKAWFVSNEGTIYNPNGGAGGGGASANSTDNSAGTTGTAGSAGGAGYGAGGGGGGSGGLERAGGTGNGAAGATGGKGGGPVTLSAYRLYNEGSISPGAAVGGTGSNASTTGAADAGGGGGGGGGGGADVTVTVHELIKKGTINANGAAGGPGGAGSGNGAIASNFNGGAGGQGGGSGGAGGTASTGGNNGNNGVTAKSGGGGGAGGGLNASTEVPATGGTGGTGAAGTLTITYS